MEKENFRLIETKEIAKLFVSGNIENQQLRQETLNAINAFHQCYPNHKESEIPKMTGYLDWSGTTLSDSSTDNK